jgi:hypothetical protein
MKKLSEHIQEVIEKAVEKKRKLHVFFLLTIFDEDGIAIRPVNSTVLRGEFRFLLRKR